MEQSMASAEHESGRRPRRFIRTRRGRLVGGVCSGLGSYFGVDPLLFRIAFVAVAFLGGAGLLLYLVFLLLVPEEGAAQAPIRALGRSWPSIVGGIVVIVAAALAIDSAAHSIDYDAGIGAAVGFVALVGLAAAALWWVLRRRPDGVPESPDRRLWRYLALGTAMTAAALLLFAAGGFLAGVEGRVAGWVVVAIGAGLIVAAFAGGARWLVLPAIAFSLPVTLVAASDADLRGGVGERVHRPDSIAEVRDTYRLGVGRLEVDLRDVRFPAGDTPLRLRLGVGDLTLLVPDEVCVAVRGRIGGGYVGALDRESGGLDVDWSNRPLAPPLTTPRLVVDGEVGLGALFVADRPFEDGRRGGFRPGAYGTNDACRGGRGSDDR
jgi:phage shock protein PspC (stress-responsive transcriptional regulator)